MIVGVTGSFGTGKTYVASLLRARGATVLDADRIAHGVIRKGSAEYRKILRAFGRRVIDKKGEIGRTKLGKVVFGNRRSLRTLNAIVHPAVIAIIRSRARRLPKGKVLVIDAPLLIEAGLAGMVDVLVVVTASRRRQIERCKRRSHIGEGAVTKRIRAQIPLATKMKKADFIIDNDGSRTATRQQVKEMWGLLWR